MDDSSRRAFLKQTAAAGALAAFPGLPRFGSPAAPKTENGSSALPVALATWDNRQALAAAWRLLVGGGHALDAVEAGVHIPEADPEDRSVGLGGRPDAQGRVTLDACIMDERHRCGSVAALEEILHPVSVARKVMEETPHVMLVGQGAQEFALRQGFERSRLLTEEAAKEWREWTRTRAELPRINIERRDPPPVDDDDHDTIGMIALDAGGRLSGACTSSGWAYKLRGRVGDSPIIGAGLFVDGEVGAATATGHGEEMIRIAAAHTMVERMRAGLAPQETCRQAVEHLRRVTPSDLATIQAGFLALDARGRFGGFALHKGFAYVVALPEGAPEPALDGAIAARVPVPRGTILLIEAPALLD